MMMWGLPVASKPSKSPKQRSRWVQGLLRRDHDGAKKGDVMDLLDEMKRALAETRLEIRWFEERQQTAQRHHRQLLSKIAIVTNYLEEMK